MYFYYVEMACNRFGVRIQCLTVIHAAILVLTNKCRNVNLGAVINLMCRDCFRAEFLKHLE
jgi:hypothetical protein